MILIDLLFITAAIGFISADLKQAIKLFKNGNNDTRMFSKTHYRIKILAMILEIIAYILIIAPFALSVTTFQLILNVYIHNMIGWRHKEGDIR
jgi:hypothetical protein